MSKYNDTLIVRTKKKKMVNNSAANLLEIYANLKEKKKWLPVFGFEWSSE